MGFEDKRNGKPTGAWSVRRTSAENGGSHPGGHGAGAQQAGETAFSNSGKDGERHPAAGDPLPSTSRNVSKHDLWLAANLPTPLEPELRPTIFRRRPTKNPELFFL